METVNQLVLDKSRLSTLASSNETAAAIFKDVSERRRIRWVTNLPRYAVKLAHKGFKVVDVDYENTWKELEAMGVGVIVRGRNGKPDRFKWNYSLKEVGTGAIHPEQTGDIKPMESSTTQEVPKKRKYVRQGFNRSKHMKKMWAQGRIKGRGHKKIGRPKSNDLEKIKRTLEKLLKQL